MLNSQAGFDMDIQDLLLEIRQVEHGFKHIIEAGEKILAERDVNHFDVAVGLLSEESYQLRMLGTHLLGELSPVQPGALKILQTQVAADPNWRVQEMLAKAFDHYCLIIGYEHAVPIVREWLNIENVNVNRAVVEGLRIWTSRPYFNANPEIAITLISQHKANQSDYLRKSVGNALRDIRKKYPALIDHETAGWDLTDIKIKFTHKLVYKTQ
jgi:hypothetical protein